MKQIQRGLRLLINEFTRTLPLYNADLKLTEIG